MTTNPQAALRVALEASLEFVLSKADKDELPEQWTVTKQLRAAISALSAQDAAQSTDAQPDEGPRVIRNADGEIVAIARRSCKPAAQSADAVEDTARIDFMEENQLGVYLVVNVVRRPTTMEYPRYEEVREFAGWTLANRNDELPTVRAAIDAARSAEKERKEC